MIYQVSSVQRVVSLYSKQKVYGDRLKAYGTNRPVVQTQNDSITISPRAVESLSAHRKLKEEKVSITYPNPRVDNPN